MGVSHSVVWEGFLAHTAHSLYFDFHNDPIKNIQAIHLSFQRSHFALSQMAFFIFVMDFFSTKIFHFTKPNGFSLKGVGGVHSLLDSWSLP